MHSTEQLATALAGRYRIERALGAGGMATVYLASDLKHDRKVAIKVLKPELAAVLGAERFVVEIKTTAALQHPHILPLFDSGEADGFLYYVMPYIQGETIREKLNRETQFGGDEAIRIAREVADALDYAHRHGVIHRDIKPENILLHDGRAMVMDFGIALAVSAAAGGRMTETGLSLGTPHYMSPEQATAEKEITPRSDVYSLASVLYEMLAGQPPHIGGAAQQVIMKIITEQAAPVNTIRKNVPPNVVAALAKALEKIPADRFESAKAFGDALANPAFSTGTDGGRAATSPAAQRRFWIPTVAAVVLAIALVTSLVRRPSASPEKAMRFSAVRLGEAGGEFDGGLSMSADGSMIAYLSTVGGVSRAYQRALSDVSARALPGTEGARELAVSPDGKAVAVQGADDTLRIVPLDGGRIRRVIKTTTPAGIAWSAKHGLVLGMPAYSRTIWGLTRVAESGDTSLTVITSPRPASMHHEPLVLDDGETVLYLDIPMSSRKDAPTRIGTGTLSGNQWRALDLRADAIVGVAKGILVYLDGGAMMAVRFDARARRVVGEPVRISGAPDGVNEAVMASDGTLAMHARFNRFQVTLVDEHGDGQALLPDTVSSIIPRFSPDGKRVAISAPIRGSRGVWMVNVADRTISRTALSSALALDWTRDGRRVAATLYDGPTWQSADGADAASPIPSTGGKRFYSLALSPDGTVAVLVTGFGEGGFNLVSRRIGGDTTDTPVVATAANEYAPRFSPDGHWLAYTSDESGRPEVYVRPYPENGPRVQVSTEGGNQAVWSGDSRHVFYRSGPAFMAADVAASGSSLSVIARRKLFEGNYYGADPTALAATYDVSPDGRSFVVGRTLGEGADEIIVWTGWLHELEAQLAGRRQ
ncbi:MAG TPA: protein kinase [Gemmatimonadales bacterium]|nr:protein kinase [Gemmatimonadales bacterium]